MQFTLSLGFCPHTWYVPLAQAAERAGWDSIAVPDGLFHYEKTSVPYPYSIDGERFWRADTHFLDPFVVIATMAAVTSRIRFYPSVLKLAVREPLLVAKELSSCAVLAAGRVALGVGLSPWPEDFEVLRQDWAQRGPRSAEQIEIIRGLLRGGMYEFHGRFYQVPRLQIAPVPERPVPIYIGGLAEPVLRRAARIYDG
jgi:alkanesulfonate monooxygenase SsuD/methylene tetrahydromethanopterin reductase-like flavin-dependent oxidoreductase (luciferase family)